MPASDTAGVARPGRRKAPAERRAEILARAVQVSLQDGLEAVTLRRVASDLGITPGLASHYFASADLLVTAAFAEAATRGLEVMMRELAGDQDPYRQIRTAINLLLCGGIAESNALWLDAWKLARRNEHLSAELTRQISAWTAALAEIIAAGVGKKAFAVRDPHDSALKILVIIDGLGLQSNARVIDQDTLLATATRFIGDELGVPPGALAP